MVDPDIKRVKNNEARMRTHNKEKERKHAMDYEHFAIKKHLETNPSHTMYHWSQIPENLLEDSGYIHDKNAHRKKRQIAKAEACGKIPQEYGLDGLGFCDLGDGIQYLPFQAKCWYARKLTAHDLGSFHLACSRIKFKHPNTLGYLYHTTELQADVQETYELTGEVIPVKLDHEIIYKNHKTDYIVQSLYPEQKSFLYKLEQPWEDGIGLMCLPCGYGKLVIGCHLAKKYNKVIVISPLRVNAKQALDRIRPYLIEHDLLLLDSDTEGTTDIGQLETVFEKSKYCISTTEKSAKEILVNYEYEKEVLILVDEIHNYNEDNILWKFLEKTSATVLGMTATRTELLANKTQELIYMPLHQAIADNKVCDYEIYLPIVEENGEYESFIPSELTGVDNIDVLSKILFLVTGMYHYGFKHCILYLSTIAECEEYKKMIEKVFEEYYYDNYEVGVITADCGAKARNDALEAFQDKTKFTFLCSIRILDENIDIPICDSVFISKISDHTSELRTIQRMCRANRKLANHPNKIAGCFLWSNSEKDICNVLNMVKNEDPGFYHKIKCVSGDYSTKNSIRKETEKTHTESTQCFVKLKCISWKERIQQKMDILIEYFETNTDAPSRSLSKDYNKHGFNLARFWQILVKGGNNDLFEEAKNKSVNLKNAYQVYLQNNTNKVKGKTAEKKMEILIEYFKNNTDAPSRSRDKIADYIGSYGFNLGQFWQSLNRGYNKELFEAAKKKSLNLKKAHEAHLQKKANKTIGKTPQEKMEILIEYFVDNTHRPSESKIDEYNIKHGFNLGHFWQSLTIGHNKDLFEEAKNKSINLKKAHEIYLEKNSNKGVQKTPEDKMEDLIEYFVENTNQPSRQENFEYNTKYGHNLGKFWSNLTDGFNKKLFEQARKESYNMENAYLKFLDRRNSHKTPEEKMPHLIEYFKTNTDRPSESKNLEYNIKYNFNLGTFWSNLVQGRNQKLFEQARSSSNRMESAFQKYLENKKSKM